MGEIWLRLILILGALAVASSVVVLRRHRAGRLIKWISVDGLDEGIYFFSSASCSTCEEARDKLDAALGREGYVEISWEDDPESFQGLDVDAVPAVLIVRDRGRGRIHSGQPDGVLSQLRGAR